jgi:hypothetical protein
MQAGDSRKVPSLDLSTVQIGHAPHALSQNIPFVKFAPPGSTSGCSAAEVQLQCGLVQCGLQALPVAQASSLAAASQYRTRSSKRLCSIKSERRSYSTAVALTVPSTI